jgi:hypothetical protein
MENTTNVFSLGISTEVISKLRHGFAVERESVQEATSANRKSENEILQNYAMNLLAEKIDERFARYEAKREKVLLQAVKVLVAGGTTVEKARQMLGLG